MGHFPDRAEGMGGEGSSGGSDGRVGGGAGGSLFYLEPVPLLLRVLGCAWLVATFGVFVIAASGGTRRAQFLLAAVGIPIGLVLSPFLGLDPKMAPPPEGPLEQVSEPALTGRAIYQQMCEVYNSAQTYADTGEIQTVYTDAFDHTEIKTFSTAFVRGEGFLFEFKQQFDRLDPWNEYWLIWKDGSSIKHWWTIEPHVAAVQNLASALGAAVGVSDMTSMEIPGRLQPENKKDQPASLFSKIELLGRQRVDGRDVYKLQLTRQGWPATMLWIDANSHLMDGFSPADHWWEDSESTKR